MLYKTITKDNFQKMVEGLMESNEVIGPKWRDRDAEGNKSLPVSEAQQL